MTLIKIEIQGQDFKKETKEALEEAAKELLEIEEIEEGSFETIEEREREGVLATIATIVGITAGTMTIAEKLYKWNQKYQESRTNPNAAKIELVAIIDSNNKPIILQGKTVEEIKEILDRLEQ